MPREQQKLTAARVWAHSLSGSKSRAKLELSKCFPSSSSSSGLLSMKEDWIQVLCELGLIRKTNVWNGRKTRLGLAHRKLDAGGGMTPLPFWCNWHASLFHRHILSRSQLTEMSIRILQGTLSVSLVHGFPCDLLLSYCDRPIRRENWLAQPKLDGINSKLTSVLCQDQVRQTYCDKVENETKDVAPISCLGIRNRLDYKYKRVKGWN